MKILMLWRPSEGFYEYTYRCYPEYSRVGYDDQLEQLRNFWSAWPSEMARLLAYKGHDVQFVFANNVRLQRQWALEHGLDLPGRAEDFEHFIVLEQVRQFCPDLLWLNYAPNYLGGFILQLRQYSQRIALWMGSPFVPAIETAGMDVLLTENPKTLQGQHNEFDSVVITKPGISKAVTERVAHSLHREGAVFFGSLSSFHKKRCEYLYGLVRKGIPLRIFAEIDNDQLWVPRRTLFDVLSYGRSLSIQTASRDIRRILPTAQGLRLRTLAGVNHGPCYGLDMYRHLAASSVAVNIHIDCAGRHSGNMRMFESTLMGCCLLTEHSDNLTELFEPDREVVVYGSKADFEEKSAWLVNHPGQAKKIGLAGYRRVVHDHGQERMFNEIRKALAV